MADSLGELIERLEAEVFATPEKVLRHGFKRPHSYRGDYSELAFEPAENVRVADMLRDARSALGSTYQGYKGGDYTMNSWTPIHLAEYGCTGETIGKVLLDYMLADVAPQQPGAESQPRPAVDAVVLTPAQIIHDFGMEIARLRAELAEANRKLESRVSRTEEIERRRTAVASIAAELEQCRQQLAVVTEARDMVVEEREAWKTAATSARAQLAAAQEAAGVDLDKSIAFTFEDELRADVLSAARYCVEAWTQFGDIEIDDIGLALAALDAAQQEPTDEATARVLAAAPLIPEASEPRTRPGFKPIAAQPEPATSVEGGE